MGVTRQYLRYKSTASFGLIGSIKGGLVTLPSKKNLVAAAAAENVNIWNLKTGDKTLTLISGEKHEVSCIAVQPSGESLAVGYEDGSLRLFDLQNGDCTVTLNGHKSGITSLCFDGPGHRLASGSKDTCLIVWDVVNERGLYRLKGHKGPITRVAFMSSRPNVLVSSSKDTFVKFWDLTVQHCFKTFAGHVTEVWDFALIRNETYLATGSSDAEMRIWKLIFRDLGTDGSVHIEPNLKKLKILDGYSNEDEEEDDDFDAGHLKIERLGSIIRQSQDRVSHILVDSTGRLLSVHGSDNTVENFLICTDEEVKKRLQKKAKKERRKVAKDETQTTFQVPEATLQEEFRRLKVVKSGGKVRHIDIDVVNEMGVIFLLTANNQVEEFRLSLDDKAAEPEKVRTFDHAGHRSDVRTVSFSSDNTAIVSGSHESIKVWNRASVSCIRSIPSGYGLCSLFVPGDRHIVLGTKKGTLQIFDLGSASMTEEVDAHSKEVWAIHMLPDKRGFVTASADQTVKFWQFELLKFEGQTDSEGKKLSVVHTRTLQLEEDALAVKVSGDGRLIAVSLLDSTIKVFFVDTLKFFLSLYGHKLPALAIDISSDSTLIATASADKNVKIWGLDFGDCHKSIFAHDDVVTSLQFVPNTHMFFTAGKDGKIKQWDADNFERILTLEGHLNEIWSMCMSPNGRFLISSGHDKTLRLWEKTQEPLVLEDERETEREREGDQQLATGDSRVIPGEQGKEVGLASKKTAETERGAERLMEAIEVYQAYLEELSVHRVECTRLGKELPTPPLPVLMTIFGREVETGEDYMAEVIGRIKSSELEETLLVLPLDLYNTRDGIPIRNLSLISQPTRYGYLDPYVNNTGAPVRPIFQNWTYIRSDRREFRQIYGRTDPFYLYMSEIEEELGTVQGVQVRAEAWVTAFFYNNTQRGFCETRIINQTLSLRFVGSNPMVFKPGMPFEAQITVRYHDQVALSQEKLESSTLLIKSSAKLENGAIIDLPEIKVPRKLEGFSAFQDIDRLQHYGQQYGADASFDTFDPNLINPAAFFSDDVESNTELIMDMYAKEKSYEEYRMTGVHRILLDIPDKTEEVKMVAYYRDTEQGSAYAETTAYAAYAPLDRHIHVRSSNRKISVGEYCVFHVKSNFALLYFDWIIVSKNIILNSGREYGSDIHAVVTTFSVVVSSEMAPGFHIIIYTATNDDYLLSDSAYFPVQAINRHKMEFSLVQLKDHLKNSVEATCRGDPGAVFISSTIRTSIFATQGKNLITKASILESLHTFERDKRHIHRVFWTDREGTTPDKVNYYPSMDYGIDTNRTFEMKDLLIFTDNLEIPQTRFTRQCNITAGQYPCLVKGCYTQADICNGRPDCEDGFDESNCYDFAEWQQEQTLKFRLSRFNRYYNFYDYIDFDGDWGWFMVNIDEDKEQFYTLEIPLTTDDWFFNVFSISKDHGIGILDEPVPFSSKRPIHFYCEGPAEIHRGESVGVRCLVMNRSPVDLEVVVILKGSDQYKFIHVEEYGYVVSYAPRLSSGDHHHLMFVRAEDEVEVHLPIAPQVEQGVIDINIELSTQIMSTSSTISITILPEGSIVHRHTSVLLDLKSRANVLRFMNIIVDETPIIPYEVYRRYIAGSPYAHVTICGDVMGPAFPGDEPVILERLFPTGHGRFGKGTEYHAFNLAANTWQLHYFRLTNQLTSNWDLAKRVFEHMNVEYTAVMRRFSSQGWVKNWDHSKPNVWLTAWVIRIFQSVSFQDWEDYIYIDPLVVSSAVMWLLNYQTEEGSFVETEHYPHPLHKPMDGRSRFDGDYADMRNISLTAHVLISLEVTAPNLQGEQKKFSASARQRAVRYLERNLPKITDHYELAITAYALATSGSAESDLAYGQLRAIAREEGGMVYWGRTPLKTNRVRYEYNRPFLEAKDYQDGDAMAVEATGYALLTMFKVEGGGVTIIQDQIVQWLNTMRLGDGGFISTVDTIVAMEALVHYSYNSRIKDITDLYVEIDIPDSNMTHTIAITGENIAKMQRIDIPNVWGHLNIVANGAGQAIAQLDVNWGVDYEPFKDHPARDCFNLTIQEYFHGRNKSEITIKSCFSWTLTEESPTSGMAMLVVDIPSGYIMLQPDANKIIKDGVIPEMKDADMEKPGKTIWYFDHIPAETRCFEHTVRRYFPVANLTRTRQAVIVEPLRPERFFVRTFNATSLYILSICEVCGSYQCPYCPYYSSAALPAVSWTLLFTTFATLFMLVNGPLRMRLQVRSGFVGTHTQCRGAT